MKRFKIVAVIAAALCLTAVLAACSTETYTPPSNDPQVTKPAISAEGTLRVGVNTGTAPLAGKASKIVGIDVDIAAAIASELGLNLEVIDVGTDGVKALRNGTVDIVMGIDSSVNESGMWKSNEYLKTAVALFAAGNSGSVPKKEDGPKIAAQVSSMSSWAVTNEFGAESLVSENDLSTVFEDLKSGKVGYAASDAIIGSYAATTIGLDATIVALMQQPSGYCVGVYDTNSELCSIIQSTLSKLVSNGTVELIETKWLGAPLNLDGLPMTNAASTPSNGNQGDQPQGDQPQGDQPQGDQPQGGEGEQGGENQENPDGEQGGEGEQQPA